MAPFVCQGRTFAGNLVPTVMNIFIPAVEAYMPVSKEPASKHDPLSTDKPDFDPDSPDLEDPQIDPPQPAKSPDDRPPAGDYPPYNENK